MIMWADVETGGLSPDKADITQVGLIFEEDGVVAQEINLLVRPDSPARVGGRALEVQGRTVQQVMAFKIGQQQAAELVYDAVYRHEHMNGGPLGFAGQKPDFDFGFLNALVYRTGCKLETSVKRPFINLMDTAARMKPGLDNLKLGTICNALGIQFRAHDALEDVRATMTAHYTLVKSQKYTTNL